MPFAFEKKGVGKAVKPVRRGIRNSFCEEAALVSGEGDARQIPRAFIPWAPGRARISVMLKSGSRRSSARWPSFYNQPVAIAKPSSLLFLPSNLGAYIIPAIGLG